MCGRNSANSCTKKILTKKFHVTNLLFLAKCRLFSRTEGINFDHISECLHSDTDEVVLRAIKCSFNRRQITSNLLGKQ